MASCHCCLQIESYFQVLTIIWTKLSHPEGCGSMFLTNITIRPRKNQKMIIIWTTHWHEALLVWKAIIFKKSSCSETDTNHGQKGDADTQSCCLLSHFPASAPKQTQNCHLLHWYPYVILNMWSQPKEIVFYSVATTWLRPAVTTTRFRQTSFISFTQSLVFLEACLLFQCLKLWPQRT
jgi:hypothetical protein